MILLQVADRAAGRDEQAQRLVAAEELVAANSDRVEMHAALVVVVVAVVVLAVIESVSGQSVSNVILMAGSSTIYVCY